jgi:hypothetical protein
MIDADFAHPSNYNTSMGVLYFTSKPPTALPITPAGKGPGSPRLMQLSAIALINAACPVALAAFLSQVSARTTVYHPAVACCGQTISN